MKILLASAAIMLCCVGCAKMKEVDFVYFNLSTNKIVVDSVAGLPVWASPGVLVPVHAEDQLSEASMTSFDPVDVSATFKINWREGTSSHMAEFKRDDLGIPARIKEGRVCFTYLGGDKWRIKQMQPASSAH
jgi:hypothetical protein